MKNKNYITQQAKDSNNKCTICKSVIEKDKVIIIDTNTEKPYCLKCSEHL